MVFKKTVEQIERLNAESFKLAVKHPIILAADNIRSGHNIGSLFRIADAFRLESVWLNSGCAKPPHPEILKTSLGAEQHVSWLFTDDLYFSIHQCKNDGYSVVAFEHCFESIPLQQFPCNPYAKYILVFGHEIHGVSQAILDLADEIVEIPQFGVKHSINVSVSAGIAVWHFIQALIK